MPFVHGKDSVFMLDAVDLSAFVNNVTFNPTADSHDVTTYGQDGHTFREGLTNGTMTVEGFHDSGASGPRDTVMPLVGAAPTSFTWQPEGAGSGNPQSTGQAQVTGYRESSPVAGYVAFVINLQVSGTVDHTDQA